jgi:hypothetical protein
VTRNEWVRRDPSIELLGDNPSWALLLGLRVTGYTMGGWRLSSNRIQEHVNEYEIGTSAPLSALLPPQRYDDDSYVPCSGPSKCKYVGWAPHDHSMPTCKVHAGAFCQRRSLRLPRCTFMPGPPITKSCQNDNGKPPISREKDLSSSRTRCSIFIFQFLLLIYAFAHGRGCDRPSLVVLALIHVSLA